jgi:hypothetical protein
MSETSAASDQEAFEYFRQLEEEWLRLKGSGGLLSAADWQVAEAWRDAGVPIDLAMATMRDVWARRRERGGSTQRISSLKYFAPSVASAWEEVRLLVGPRQSALLDAVDVPERLSALASAIPDGIPDAAAWRRRLGDLSGDTKTVEDALAEFDRVLIERLIGSLEPAERAALDATVEKRLAPLLARLSVEQAEESRPRLLREAVRRRFRVPVFSLFTQLEPSGG